MNQQLKVFDRQLALERAGGNPQLADELFGMLIKELPTYRQHLSEALASGDLAAVRNHAHKLKGSATYCGVPALGAAAERLETDLKRGDSNRAGDDVAAVLLEIERVLQLPLALH